MSFQPLRSVPIKTRRLAETTICLGGDVPVSPSEVTFINGPIPYKYRIKEFYCPTFWFLVNSVHLRLLYDKRGARSTTGVPSGTNIFGQFSNVDFIREVDAEWQYTIPMSYLVDEMDTYLKLHVSNLTAPAFTNFILIKIEEVK